MTDDEKRKTGSGRDILLCEELQEELVTGDRQTCGKEWERVREMRGKAHEGFQQQMTGEGGTNGYKDEDKEKASEHRWRV